MSESDTEAADEKAAEESTADDRASRLARWDRHSRPVVILAALVPLVVVVGDDRAPWFVALIDSVAWAVFAVDLVVRCRLSDRYLRTAWGRFDLLVVVVTFPWYLVFGHAMRFAASLRLVRLVRVVVVAVKVPAMRQVARRLNKAALYGLVVLLGCSYITWQAEKGGQDGFDSYGDALWWGVVTVTTVGYGDLVPETVVGRVSATFLALSGFVFIGAVAASLSALFRVQDTSARAGAPEVGDDARPPGQSAADVDADADAAPTPDAGSGPARRDAGGDR